MSNGRDISQIVEAARSHYKTVSSDIANAKDRVEHIRLTALAQQAHNLLLDLIEFETGLVYTHSAAKALDQINERPVDETPLDLPEFRSPYKPQD
jgi:hypothetical protein